MLTVKVTNIDEGNLVSKVNYALDEAAKDIARRPENTTKRGITIKIALTPMDAYVAVEYQVVEVMPSDPPIKTIAFMDGDILVKQLPLFDNVREAKNPKEKNSL